MRTSDTHERLTAWKDWGLALKGLDISQRKQIEDAYLKRGAPAMPAPDEVDCPF
jgi:hypothetical protein